jgi:putative addiction module killer protein
LPQVKSLFANWLDDQDLKVQSIVLARLDRVCLGNFGDCTRIKNGDGVWERPGYPIYFGKNGMSLVILLAGGEKKSQRRDIAKAKRYWIDFEESLDG